jgi:lysophospholipase L1-like esterase
MSKRAIVLAVLGVIAGVVYAGSRSQQSNRYDLNNSLGAGNAVEIREYLYSVGNTWGRGAQSMVDMGIEDGYLIGPQYENMGSDERRLLVFGDSYTFGWGIQNLDARWSAVLEEELEQSGGGYEIVGVATPGASLYTYARWAEHITRNPEKFGNFDAVIIGFTENDIVPGVHDEGSGVDTMDLDAGDLVMLGTKPDPNAKAMQEAIATITQVAEKQVLVPLYGVDERYRGKMSEVAEVFGSSGWKVAEMGEALGMIGSKRASELTVARFDTHPNEELNAAYGRDAARVVAKLWAGSQGSADSGVVSNVLPQETSVEVNTAIEARISGSGREGRCTPVRHPEGEQRCGEAGSGEVIVRGEQTSLQGAPCLEFGRGWSLIGLRRGAGEVRLRVLELEAGAEIWAREPGREWVQVGGSGEQRLSQGTREIAVVSGGEGCAYKRDIVAPTYRIELRRG